MRETKRITEQKRCPECGEMATVSHGHSSTGDGDGNCWMHRWQGCDCWQEWSIVLDDCPLCIASYVMLRGLDVRRTYAEQAAT